MNIRKVNAVHHSPGETISTVDRKYKEIKLKKLHRKVNERNVTYTGVKPLETQRSSDETMFFFHK